MLGLLALGLTAFMIFTLVKNALGGIQLNSNDKFSGKVALIIPMTSRSEFFLEPWIKNLTTTGPTKMDLNIHILVDGHHPSLHALEELREKLPYVEIHSFLVRPAGRESVPWMIEQIIHKIDSEIVIIGDPELVPTQNAFSSLAKLVSEKQCPFFVVPQTARNSSMGEAVACVNPTLAYVSFFGFNLFNYRKNFSNPLESISQGWMGMPISTFTQFDWHRVNIPSWKDALAKGWALENKSYSMAFGEKHLLRYYSEDLKAQIYHLKKFWEELWQNGERQGLVRYLIVLFIWSFPILCLFSHPFWSLGSVILLLLYRFFTKIVFQESWTAVLLHPIATIVWIGTFFWWLMTDLQKKYHSRRSGPF